MNEDEMNKCIFYSYQWRWNEWPNKSWKQWRIHQSWWTLLCFPFALVFIPQFRCPSTEASFYSYGWRRLKWINDGIMQTMTTNGSIVMDRIWTDWYSNWLIQLICQIDFLAFAFFATWNFPNHEAYIVAFLSLSFLFLFLVFSTSVPFVHFCKIAVKSVGLFCLLYFFFIQVVVIVFFKGMAPPSSTRMKKSVASHWCWCPSACC